MIINSEIFDFYIENGNVDKYKESWIFKYLKGLSVGKDVFVEPSYTQKDIKIMIRIATEIKKLIKSFKPNNIEIWDLLFPNWDKTFLMLLFILL